MADKTRILPRHSRDLEILRMDVHNRSNVGYAFINFLRPDDAEACLQMER